MKRLFSLLLVACMLLAGVALAESWTCPNCSTMNDHNFCGECGTKKPDEWTCSGCGRKNDTRFCPDCGMSRANNNAPVTTMTPVPTQTPAPTQAPKPAEAQLKVAPRVEFHRLDNYAMIYASYDSVIYAGDFDEEISYHVGCRVDNLTAASQTFKLTAEINGEPYSFADYTIAPNDDHGFMITSLKLEPGTYAVKWFLDGALASESTLTVVEGNSPDYQWIKDNLTISTGLCLWDTVKESRVESGLMIGDIGKLGEHQKYIPHFAVKNTASADSPAMFVSFYLDDGTWWWEDQVLEGGKTVNYVHTSYEHKAGVSELIMYVNGIRMDSTMFAIME